MAELKKKTEAMLRAVLISSPRGVVLRRLDREYRSITYSSIPYQEMGCPTLEYYIKSIPNVATLTRDVDGELVVKGVASESDKHVAKLIAKQRKPKKRSKPGAKSARRPTFGSWPYMNRPNPVYSRSAFVARPGVAVAGARHAVRPSAVNTNIKPSISPASRSVNRFQIPPRMRKHLNKATAQRGVQQNPLGIASTRKVELVSQAGVDRTVVERGVTRQVEQQARQIASANNRKVSMVTPQESGQNWQGMEVTFSTDNKNEEPEHGVFLSKSSASKDVDSVDLLNSLSKEDLKIYSRIQKLLEEKPKGLWLKRIGAVYKKLYNQELPNDKLERLKKLPSIAKCEEFPGGTIVYPSKLEEKPAADSKEAINGDSARPVELYTLRPRDLPAIGTTSEVTVSHIDNPAHFFIQHNHDWEKIEALCIKLNEYFHNQGDVLPMVKQGMFCCAEFTEDKNWYRARIVESYTKGDTPQAQVIYVDFGNHEPLPVSRLRMLRKEQAELPMMAVLCALEGVTQPEGGKWSAASIERFKELCDSGGLQMKVVRAEGNHLYVELRDGVGCNINATMKKESHANSSSTPSSSTSSSLTESSSTDSFSSSSTATSSSSSVSHASPAPTPGSGSNEKETREPEDRKVATRPFLRHRFSSKDEEVQKIPERVPIPDEDYLDVFVCNVHSTDNICINLSGENFSEKLTALEQSMLCHYEEPSSEEALKINPGSIFAIWSKDIHSEGLWYRVKVLKVKGDRVHIEYLDYGDTGTVFASSLKSIPPRFLELPFQALTISLDGLPKTKNAEVILKLKHMTLNKDLVAEVIKKNGNTVTVELWDTSSEDADININRILRSLVIPDEEMVPVLPKVGEQIYAFVTYVTQEGHIFIQIPGGGTTRLEELMDDISEHYSQPTKAAEFVSSPQKDKIVCAKCSDGTWYRAVVTEVLPDRQVEVQYVDYGNTEELILSSLRQPARAISHVNSLPFQALKCRLEGADKSPLTEEQVYDIMERNVLLEVVQASDVPIVRLFIPTEDDNEPTLVNLGELIGVETERPTETQDEIPSAGNDDAVSESLDEVGSVDGDSVASESSSDASKSPDEADKMVAGAPPSLDLSKPWVDISILEYENPGLFMFQCLEFLQQKEVLEDKIQEYYTNRERTPFREVKAGVVCAVLNAEDNTWYRAVIKASLSPQQICVRFADYGDFSIVSSTSIQALPDEFKQLPLMAVQGCLHGVEPVGSDDFAEWSREAVQRFEELAVRKKLVAKPRGVASHNRSTNEETKISLELYDTSEGSEDVLIADVLVSEGLARKINESR